MTSPALRNEKGFYELTVDGQQIELPSWSKVSGVLDKPALAIWKMKTVAAGLAANPDLIELAASGDTYQAARQALDRQQAAANTGTAIHRVLEDHDMGVDVSRLDGRLADAVATWIALKERFGIEVLDVERTVVNLDLGYAGTFDRRTLLSGLGRRAVISDLKTGKAVYPDVALQLCAYANATHMVTVDGDLEEMPDTSRTHAAVLHLPADNLHAATVVPVDISGAWLAVQSIARIWHWQRTSKEALLRDHPVCDPDRRLADRRVKLRALIDGLGEDGKGQLKAAWPADVPRRFEDLTHRHIDALGDVVADIERAVGASFGEAA